MSAVRVLAVDVGGTHTRAAIADSDGNRSTLLRERRYASREWRDLAPLLVDFLAAGPERPERACIAVAGPVTDGGARARVTNLPWQLERDQLRTDLDCEALELINDFAAVGLGIAALAPEHLLTLQAGELQARAPRAVLGAGTGLGQALLMPGAAGYTVFATEGGHVDFAPQSELQWALWRELQHEFGHVSCERLVSGPGLVYIHRFLCAQEGIDSAAAAQAPAHDDPAAIATAALTGSDPLAVRALDEFVRIYGAQAGNLALNCLPFGGLYLAGGITPKILGKLRDGSFLAAFNAKGRMEPVTRRIPVHAIMHPNPGLLGAALYAGRPRAI